MNITIHSEDSAVWEITASPGRWHVISIREGETSLVDKVADLCLSLLKLKFHDIWLERHAESGRYKLATQDQIREAIDWSKGKDDILVHCAAGVSRSSATAYVIACASMSPQEAMDRFINKNFHSPNEHIVRLGSEILAEEEILRVWKKFKDDKLQERKGRRRTIFQGEVE